MTLIALELLRSREEALLVARERGSFLNDVADGRLNRDDIASTAEKLGFQYRRGALLPMAIAQDSATRAGPGTGEAEWVPVLREVRDCLSAHAIAALVGSAGSDGGAILLLVIASVARRRAAAELCAGLIRDASRKSLGSAELAVISVGPAIEAWEGVTGALRQTIDTVALARTAPRVNGTMQRARTSGVCSRASPRTSGCASSSNSGSGRYSSMTAAEPRS